MKRTISQVDGTRYIHTTNGVDTRTAPLYLKELKDYRPEANGFVTELADDILHVVHTRPELWDQGSWRHVFWADPVNEPELWAAFAGLSGIEAPKGEPACGTTMCIAGWGAELAGADWMIDVNLLGKSFNNEEQVLVTEEQWAAMRPCMAEGTVSNLDLRAYRPELATALRERGFTDKHLVVSTSAYATGALGLIHGDWLGLFEGDNDLEDVESKIAGYARYGVTPSEEALVELRGNEAEATQGTLMNYFGLSDHLTDCARAAMAPA